MAAKDIFTVEEVAAHNVAGDCWVIVHGKVYDVTSYLDEHPGGDQVLLVAAGDDATDEFDEAGHSSEALKLMEQFLVGEILQSSGRSGTISEYFYTALPVAATALVVGLVVGTILWRRSKR